MRAALLLLCAAMACTPSWKQTPHQAVYQRQVAPALHEKPKGGWEVSDWWDFGLHSTVVPLAKSLSPARLMAATVGNKPSLDVNAFGKVPDSPWFENRITRRGFSSAELVRGPNRLGGPAAGPLIVESGKTEGSTPGLVLRDSEGVRWFVKFDPPAFRGLSTSAELIASKFLYAAGYWVPETYVLELSVGRLKLGKGAWTRDDYNRKIPLTTKKLDALVTLMNPDPQGHLRTLFSRSVPGEPLGPFSYRGVRIGDPNDVIPHQRRRSLRGLWVLAAWLNNTDTRRQNTLDTFLPNKDGKGYVRHYLIDFGDSLGASGSREKYKGESYEARIDWGEIGKRAFALGLYYPYWLPIHRSPYRSVGIFESKVFDPAKWAPVVANAAFEEAEADDTFWGASILARFGRPLIEAAVDAAHYRERGAAEYIVKTLVERREKLLRFVFAYMLPIDEPRVEDRYRVVFEDLEVLGGLRASPQRYQYSVRWNRTGARDQAIVSGTTAGPSFDLRNAVTRVMTSDRKGFEADPFLTLVVRRGSAGGSVVLHLRAVRDFLLPVSLSRSPGRRGWSTGSALGLP